MKKIKYYIGILSLICFSASCSDYLDIDKKTDTSINYDEIFKNPHTAPGFLNNAYNKLTDGFDRGIGGELLAVASDEAKFSKSGGVMQFFNNNAISPSYNPDDVWSSMYEGIRKCNIFLKEMDPDKGLIAKYNSIPAASRDNYRGQAYFLRAYFHFELLKRYQNIIFVDKVLDPNNEAEIYSFPQIPFAQAVDRIAQDCDSAIRLLPAKYDAAKNAEMIGRPTKAAPMALKSRMFLYAASPLNNPTNDVALWERAETAAAAIYTQAGDLGLGLLDKGAYAEIFTSPNNKEVIFATGARERNDIERYNFPISFQGNGLVNPTQDLVDTYVMKSTSYANPMNGYDPENPYTGREDRFYASIIYNDMIFKGNKVETFVEGKDGLNSTATATKTGYYLKKFSVESINLEKGDVIYRQWILFRYAEVLLNYAEARNEVLAAPDKTIHDLLNLIRLRAGLRNFSNASQYIKSKEEMRDYIKLERRKELAFEDHRFWDLRRWKDADALAKTITGMRIVKVADGVDGNGTPKYKFTYTPFNVEKRLFDTKLYWYPIPRTEILKYANKGITLNQNPGWN
ncbi:MAG: RagB/SusD family nutrient uptake outer membrane protein [Dysgonomonas sp.]